jgi:hypothetical protein
LRVEDVPAPEKKELTWRHNRHGGEVCGGAAGGGEEGSLLNPNLRFIRALKRPIFLYKKRTLREKKITKQSCT